MIAWGAVLVSVPFSALAEPASGGTSSAGSLAFTATSDPSGQAVPGATIQYHFQITNGDAYTDRDWNATTTAPLGTTLSPQSQTCGSGGGSCSQSSSGDELDWQIPAGTAPKAFFVLSFSVLVPNGNPPQEIRAGLMFSGPGCEPNATCEWDAPTVTVLPPGTPAELPAMARRSMKSDGVSAASLDTPKGLMTTTTNPVSDEQNVVVEVPDCDKRGKKVRCKEPPEGRGGNAQAGRGDPHRSASQGGEPARALAATGDNQVRAVKAALACVLAGSLLVVLARGTARRSGRVSFGDTLN